MFRRFCAKPKRLSTLLGAILILVGIKELSTLYWSRNGAKSLSSVQDAAIFSAFQQEGKELPKIDFPGQSVTNVLVNTVSSQLKMFTAESYQMAKLRYPPNPARCKKNKSLVPVIVICAHDPKIDIYISKAALYGRGWEPSMTKLIGTALTAAGGDAVYLDVGANIGSHAMYGAAMGRKVWAVEPLTMNHAKIYEAAEIMGVGHLMHQVQNIVDLERSGVLNMEVMEKNIGGSRVIGDSQIASGAKNTESISAVLLSDIFEDIIADSRSSSVSVVLKIDIELFECRAFLGSKSIFFDKRIRIPYIVMEWNFLRSKPGEIPRKYSSECTENMLNEMTQLFIDSGYKPYNENTRKVMDSSKSFAWVAMNVLWVHESAKPLL